MRQLGFEFGAFGLRPLLDQWRWADSYLGQFHVAIYDSERTIGEGGRFYFLAPVTDSTSPSIRPSGCRDSTSRWTSSNRDLGP